MEEYVYFNLKILIDLLGSKMYLTDRYARYHSFKIQLNWQQAKWLEAEQLQVM